MNCDPWGRADKARRSFFAGGGAASWPSADPIALTQGPRCMPPARRLARGDGPGAACGCPNAVQPDI